LLELVVPAADSPLQPNRRVLLSTAPGNLLPQSNLAGQDCLELSTKAEYGLVALLELGSIHPSGKLLQVAEIARRQGIPERYLEQMLTALRRGGLLHSLRGPRGGYRLARPPAEIHLDEVVDCLEGLPARRQACGQPSVEFRVLGVLEERLQRARRRILEQTRLDQLLEERQSLSEPQPMFFI
jgi:Rrf2 family protein